jgi:hypothetical protein
VLPRVDIIALGGPAVVGRRLTTGGCTPPMLHRVGGTGVAELLGRRRCTVVRFRGRLLGRGSRFGRGPGGALRPFDVLPRRVDPLSRRTATNLIELRESLERVQDRTSNGEHAQLQHPIAGGSVSDPAEVTGLAE